MPDGTMETRDVEHQTHQVMKNLFYVLEAAGAHFNDVIKTTIYLTDMNDFKDTAQKCFGRDRVYRIGRGGLYFLIPTIGERSAL